MRATTKQPQRAPDGAQDRNERHRSQQTTLYCHVQLNAASSVAHSEASTDAELPRFFKAEPGRKQSGGQFVSGLAPHVPVSQWVLSLPIPLRVLLAALPEPCASKPN